MQKGNSINVAYILDELSREKGMSRDDLIEVIQEGIAAAYKKKYPYSEFNIVTDKKKENILIFTKKKVVQSVYDEDIEISIRKARAIDENISIDDDISVPFVGSIGRIEMVEAKDVISQKIKDIEAFAIYKEFFEKIGTLATGVVNKIDRYGIHVSLFDSITFLPYSMMIPEEKFNVGNPIKVLIKNIFKEYNPGGQIVLDRISIDFIKKLFELEIPEIYDNIITIEKAVRIAGYKTKIFVSSKDSHIDPLGSCVGVGGSRIKPILKELSGEKIDIIPFVEDKKMQIAEAIKPGFAEKIDIVNGKAYIHVLEENRAVTIGKGGRNIDLASQLAGIEIDIVDLNKN